MRSLTAKRKGFTLVEVLVVMAIGITLASSLGAGIVYPQNSVKLDNTIRDLKAQIQSTQNNARNSFIANETIKNTSLANTKVSVGWIAEVSNNGNSTIFTKRSVYFIPGNSYDFTQLRTHIEQNIKNKSASFFCINDQLYSVVNNSRTNVKFPGMPANEVLRCSNDSQEKTQVEFKQIQLNDSNEGIANCVLNIDSALKASLFFTSGYGEAVISNPSCQIKIQNSNGPMINGRSIYIAKGNGSVGTCGVYCGKDEVVESDNSEIALPTLAPACAKSGELCGSGCCSGLRCSALGRCVTNSTGGSCVGLNESCSGGKTCCSGYSCNSGICSPSGNVPAPGPDPF